MYLYNTRFRVFTDSRAAKALLEANDAKAGGRLLRWRLALAEFDFDVTHRSGVKSGNVDALSRFHLARTEPYGEGTTDIYPATALNAIDIDPTALQSLHQNQLDNTNAMPYGQGDPPTPLVKPTYFADADTEAWTTADWIQLQNNDTFCTSIRTKIANADARITRRFRIHADGLLYKIIIRPNRPYARSY
jgi:hypothetical protein